MKATCIEWDTDGNEDILSELPTEINLPDEIAMDEDGNVDYDGIDDYLSDKTGFCHTGYVLED